MLLNLGCGSQHITDAINIDCTNELNPDIVHDIRTPLPYAENTVDEVYLFHTIEHVQKRFHYIIFENVWRVLKMGGLFLISYPEFRFCAENWLNDYMGQKEFWEATIFGRQAHPADHHVCIMDSLEVTNKLKLMGFDVRSSIKESEAEPFNTLICAIKIDKPITYEQVVVDDVNKIVYGK